MPASCRVQPVLLRQVRTRRAAERESDHAPLACCPATLLVRARGNSLRNVRRGDNLFSRKAKPVAQHPHQRAAPAADANEPVTAESLGWQLRSALPPMRLHSVSIYNAEADVLWLSEGALGPDEHNVVVEAIEAQKAEKSPALLRVSEWKMAAWPCSCRSAGRAAISSAR